MAKRQEHDLSRRERQIMDVVYARGKASALEVLADLPDPPSKTAVRTLLRILEAKGHLEHTQVGQTYVYRARRPREHAVRASRHATENRMQRPVGARALIGEL